MRAARPSCPTRHREGQGREPQARPRTGVIRASRQGISISPGAEPVRGRHCAFYQCAYIILRMLSSVVDSPVLPDSLSPAGTTPADHFVALAFMAREAEWAAVEHLTEAGAPCLRLLLLRPDPAGEASWVIERAAGRLAVREAGTGRVLATLPTMRCALRVVREAAPRSPPPST